jgi:hypothetical protein
VRVHGVTDGPRERTLHETITIARVAFERLREPRTTQPRSGGDRGSSG